MYQLSERTIGQWLEYWAENDPDKEYIVYSDRNLRWTYRYFNSRVDELAKGLMAIGVKQGTHVIAESIEGRTIGIEAIELADAAIYASHALNHVARGRIHLQNVGSVHAFSVFVNVREATHRRAGKVHVAINVLGTIVM